VGDHPRKPCAGPLFAPNRVNFQILSTVKVLVVRGLYALHLSMDAYYQVTSHG
jgi:hypothetical protein